MGIKIVVALLLSSTCCFAQKFPYQNPNLSSEERARDLISRLTLKGKVLYATAMGWPPEGKLVIKSLAKSNRYYAGEIQKIELPARSKPLSFIQTEKGLEVTLPQMETDQPAYVLKLLLQN
ncbi:MAG: alpha-L-fucosidase C-terminal domain-containing protein [Flavisolibacter sp.]